MIPHLSVGLLVLVLVLTGFFATVSRVSVFLLHGLHAYLLPEEGDKQAFDSANGADTSKEKEAEEVKKSSDGKEKKKSISGFARHKRGKKDTRDVWDEAGSQILRVHLAESQLETRKYFQEYDEAIIYSLLGLIGFVTREILQIASTSLQTKYEWAQYLSPDDRITFMVGVFAVYKLIRLLSKVGYDPRLARSSERLLSWAVGVLGFAVACIVLILVPSSLVDFGIDEAVLDAGKAAAVFMQNKGVDAPAQFAVSPASVKLVLAIFAGIMSGLLFGTSMRNVKSFWVGTDQLEWNIAVLKRGPLVHVLLNLSIVLPMVVSVLWLKPMAGVFIRASNDMAISDQCVAGVGDVSCGLQHEKAGLGFKLQDAMSGPGVIGRVFILREYDWAEGVGFSETTFSLIQLWGLFLVGLLQVCLFRVNLQSYCNGAVLSWYESLHQSKVHNPEVTKAKIFLNNYFVCRIALQSLLPGVLVLLFLGLVRSRGAHLDESGQQGAFFFAPSFVRALMLFGSWWTVFTWALQTSVVLALFRLGIMSSTA